MKSFGLTLRKWGIPAVALFALYVAIMPGSVLVRVSCVVVAATGGLLWKSRRVEVSWRETQAVMEKMAVRHEVPAKTPASEWARQPKRYPRPVLIHRMNEFQLYPYWSQ
jgi:hypothetical protein